MRQLRYFLDLSAPKIIPMKINRFGKAEILNPQEITLLFTEGLVKPRDRALFGVCLYAAARINESCTLQREEILIYFQVGMVWGISIKLVLIGFSGRHCVEWTWMSEEYLPIRLGGQR